MSKRVNPKSLANLNRKGKPKGTKNRINRDMGDHIKDIWEKLQDDGHLPEKEKTNLYELAVKDPWRFYEFVKGMLPKDIFINAKVNFRNMSPEEIDAELIRLATLADELEDTGD